uniref:Uncharacterized protein n=1 Tax=Arundo donax TaxID=35708 RepID=A0A0A9FE73_ARUDO
MSRRRGPGPRPSVTHGYPWLRCHSPRMEAAS